MQVVCDDMVVVRDLTELPPSEPQQANLFVLSNDPLLLHLLITTASSFSISLGEAARPRTCSQPAHPPRRQYEPFQLPPSQYHSQ